MRPTDPVTPAVAHPPPAGWVRLPLRITMFVFWGLVLLGMAAAVFVLGGLERRMAEHYVHEVDTVAFHVHQRLHEFPASADGSLARELEALRLEYRLAALELLVDGATVRVGTPRPGDSRYERPIDLYQGGARPRQARLVVYQEPLTDAIATQRKQLLLGIGVAFLVLGAALAWLLRRVLTRPFTEMVATAARISAGDTAARFDAARGDEFGFLAGFVNEALERALAQQREIRAALEQLQLSEAELQREKERAEVTLHSIADAVITTDAGGRIEYLNPAAERLTGWEAATARGRALTEVLRLIDEASRLPLENPVARCLADGAAVGVQERALLVRRDGAELAVADSAAPVRDDRGAVRGAVLVLRDTGAARRLARQLSYQASHDALTGLYNRHEFERQLQAALDEAHRDRKSHVLCYLDLDQFKIVNDTCGHVAGDELLRQLAQRLHAQVRSADVLARLGGDEFGVLLRYCSLAQAQHVAEALLDTVRGFDFAWGEHHFECGVSIGLVAVEEDSASVAELLSAADVACYAAKDQGRNRVRVFEPDDEALRQRRGDMQWVPRLRRAIAEDRLRLYYQEIASLQNPRAQRHIEVLLRLVDERGQVVPPMAFLPAAERYNLMPEIDRWVVRAGLAHLAGGCPLGCHCVFAINLSGQSLCDDTFLPFVIEQLERLKIDPTRVCFEITETAAIANLTHAARFIEVLRGMGCRFALDDFGSGLSSFAYLKNLRVDYLKIAGNFVKDMVEDRADRAMVQAIAQIGQVMGIRTVAEFVENQAIVEALTLLGVDYAQGYAIGRPAPLPASDGAERAACA